MTPTPKPRKHRSSSSFNNRIDKWLRARPWELLWFCLPALLAGGVLLLILILVLSRQSTGLNARYDAMAKKLFASRKFEEARVASLHGLSEVTDSRVRAQKLFYLAVALNGLGHQQEALQLMDLAAPLDHPGCAEAHIMMAQSLLSSTNLTSEVLRGLPRNATNATTELLRKAERQLLNAIALDPQSLPANELLGRFYLKTEDPAKAQKYLLPIYSAKPDVALLLAHSCLETNDQSGALQWADRAVNAFEQNLVKSAPRYLREDVSGWLDAVRILQTVSAKQSRAQSGASAPAPVTRSPVVSNRVVGGAPPPPPDDSPFWIRIVRLLLAKGKYAPAMETLEQRLLVNPNPIYASAIADVCDAWARSIPPTQKDGSALRLQLIEKGLTNAPQRLNLQLLLAAASHATDQTGAAARKLLDDSIASTTNQEASAWWHFALWTDARFRGDLPAARKHLQTAYQLAPQIPHIKNDMAMDLATGSSEQAEQGLKLIQSLLLQFPGDADLRGTRGQILAKLGRNQEALEDLEYAVPRTRNAAALQRDLAKVYAALGRTAPAPQAHPAALLSKARDLAGQRKYAEALAILEPEMRQSPNAAYASAIADICAAWVDKTPAAQSAERFRLIQKGLSYDPQHPALMALLLQATHDSGATGPAASKLMDQLVATAVGDAAAEWHLFLGLDTRARGDVAASRQQLQTAFGLAPERTDIKSALADVLVAGSQDDWQEALQLIQPALDQFPENPEYRNTRGLLLARLGQNKAAAADLEYAVAKLPNPSASRLELAKVYDALGKPQLADQQRRLAAGARP